MKKRDLRSGRSLFLGLLPVLFEHEIQSCERNEDGYGRASVEKKAIHFRDRVDQAQDAAQETKQGAEGEKQESLPLSGGILHPFPGRQMLLDAGLIMSERMQQVLDLFGTVFGRDPLAHQRRVDGVWDGHGNRF